MDSDVNHPTLEPFSQDRLNVAGENFLSHAQLNLSQTNAVVSNSPADKFPTIATLDSTKVWITRINEDGFDVRCDAGEVCWRPMVTTHWPRLLEHYDYILAGR